MECQPEVAVLVVSHRHEAFITRCLDSVRAQTVPTQLIIVDDASPDATVAVARRWLSQHDWPALVVAKEINQGLGMCLAEGLTHVRAPLVAYIAADDWMEPHRFERQIAALEEAGPEAVLAYSDCYRADREGRRLLPDFSDQWSQWWSPEATDVFGALLDHNWIPAPTILMRTEALRLAGGYDPHLDYEDTDVCLRMARRGRFVLVDEPLATHRELDDSLGVQLFHHETPRWRENELRILLKHVDLDTAYDGQISRRLREKAIKVYLAGGDRALVRRVLAIVRRSAAASRTVTFYRWAVALGVPGPAISRILSRWR